LQKEEGYDMKVYYKRDYPILLLSIWLCWLLICCAGVRIKTLSGVDQPALVQKESLRFAIEDKGALYGVGIGLDLRDLSSLNYADIKLEIYISSSIGDNALSTTVIDFKQASEGLGLAEKIKTLVSINQNLKKPQELFIQDHHDTLLSLSIEEDQKR
jgi:hypothetical protein